MNTELPGQMTWSDILSSPSMKTSPELSLRGAARTGDSFWSTWPASQTKKCQFLDLRKENGNTRDASSEATGLWHGDSWTPSISECRRDESESVASYLSTKNVSDAPTKPIITKLLWVLETLSAEELDRYSLSLRAAAGILTRASRRGKALPEILKKALESVIARATTLCK